MAKKQSSIVSSETREIRYAEEFRKQYSLLCDAAVGVTLIKTREPARVLEELHRWAIAHESEFKSWTILDGWRNYPSIIAFGDESIEPGVYSGRQQEFIVADKAFAAVRESTESSTDFPVNGVYVFIGLERYWESPAIQQHIKEHNRKSATLPQRVVFVVPEATEIPPQIENDLYVLDFRTPSFNELKDIWESIIDGSFEDDDRKRMKLTDDDVAVIIQNSSGMSAHEFETAVSLALVKGSDKIEAGTLRAADIVREILAYKVAVIKKTSLLELMATARMGEIGGLDLLKEWVAKRRKAFTDEARAFGIDKPKGILLCGPPGTGKSKTAKAVASELQVPCIRLDIGRVFGQFVGQSEERMRAALKMVEAMAPCVLFLDEIDKGLGGIGGSSDSGTTSRVFGTFLTWMQERPNEESPIFVVMTANNVIGLPPELMRKGRVDEIFAITFPSAEERIEILNIHLKQRGHEDDISQADMKRFAAETKDFVGAEIEAVVVEALIEAFDQGSDVVTIEHLIGQAQKVIPLSVAHKDKVAVMHEWAKNNARAASRDIDFARYAESAERARPKIMRRKIGRRIKPSTVADN